MPFSAGLEPQATGDKNRRMGSERPQKDDADYTQKENPFPLSFTSTESYMNILEKFALGRSNKHDTQNSTITSETAPIMTAVESNPDAMSIFPGARSSRPKTTVTEREMEADISPTDTTERISCQVTVEPIANEPECMIHQNLSSSKKATSKLAGPKGTYHSTPSYDDDDNEVYFDAVMWSSDLCQADFCCQLPPEGTGTEMGQRVLAADGTVMIGTGVQILEDTTDSTYGVPVTKASIDTVRRDSGIRFTLTCIEDGYEDAEVLFDDDFLYEEEMMDPDYFRKKGSVGCEAPLKPRPALLRISSY
ncbi:hypothetical protein MPH_06113 [Macrophomina phaseolina MS6]|uniref:Uncharacterized protein n=1 Tax=Macrophomina phaseolina (strain MS6) TaxID=1126212 RepID=K2S2D2_MACPH|nr:hypothetical protein MPH_06113 [Macrophomina phaseolina MS6]